jgi:hypothetical protein
MNRLIIDFKRITRRDALGNPSATVREQFNIVHPEDEGRKLSSGAFRDIGAMLKSGDYMDVTYTKTEAAI